MKTGLRRQVRRWRRRRFAAVLERLGEGELDILLGLARLWARWPRRWWWVEEVEEAWVIGE